MPYSYHLKLDVKLVKLSNLVSHTHNTHQGLEQKLFIRYHIPTFNNRRIQVDSTEIQSKNNVLWDESASFEFHANSDIQIEHVENSKSNRDITFELRSRSCKKGFGGILTRSRLLGRGEISWKDVVGSEGMKLEKWVNFSAKGERLDEFKLPNLLVEMKLQVTRDVDLNGKRKCRFTKDFDRVECEINMFQVETLVD